MSDKVAHRASTVLDDLLTYVSQQTGLDVGQFEWYSWPHYFPTTAGPRGAGGSSMTAHQIIAFEAYGPKGSMRQMWCSGIWKSWSGEIGCGWYEKEHQ